jgi:alanyl-tRNA synthetase
MGFERMCAVLQGKRSNYETDVFQPIMDSIVRETGVPYEGEANQTAIRVIADHIRMLSFSIADGALPGNEGRGYVLRRILRRAARFGRTLGRHEPFIYRITASVVSTMGAVFPELAQNQSHIERVIRAEEENFNQTLDRGLEIFQSVLDRIGQSRIFPGEDAFRLYDTYGFPLDLTQLMAEERGLTVETETFHELMEQQRARGRESGRVEGTKSVAAVADRFVDQEPSQFVGYEELETKATLKRIVESRYLVLDRTPFYVESGGQVDDIGTIVGSDFVASVLGSFRAGERIVHEVKILHGTSDPAPGQPVTARVDTPRRLNIQRNHSATHLVHEALRRVLGTHVHQQGSLVAPDRLRFDFPHFSKITPEELRAIEEMVNQRIADDIPVHTERDIPIQEARKIPNVKMFFGDKYGDRVRVVFIDEAFSVEFCGGTHVASTKDIGLFKIISEGSIASGIRRIEAVTGDGLLRYIDQQMARHGELTDQLAALLEERENLLRELRSAAPAADSLHRPSLGTLILPPSLADAVQMIDRSVRDRDRDLQRVTGELADLRRELSHRNVDRASRSLDDLIAGGRDVRGIRVVAAQVPVSSMDELRALGDALRARLGRGAGVLAGVEEQKVSLVCVVTDDLVRSGSLHAGTLAGAVAKMLGGKGGGRPHMATAGGKDTSRLPEALAATYTMVQQMLEKEKPA